MKFYQRVLVNAIVFIALAGFMQSSHLFFVSSFWVAIVASLILAILNAVIKPFLIIISLPITILTLGLFSIVINAAMLELTSAVVGSQSFYFKSFGVTMVVAIIISIVNAVISKYVNKDKDEEGEF
ncbi:phage holin family protein [Periweissella cryptocerci]|uniref:Phage holin family protein n=1 Tax=Periweissella cryptocerci TaxID=2506420 RepID=A0A4P6YT34_9LACO|nr:phage holin family protein [Periweissella cryptocerci]QBO35894.1 phage holin family protein [Periweissella cryptocerci]